MTRQMKKTFDQLARTQGRVIDQAFVAPASGEVVIGDVTLDALIANTVREFARNEPKDTSWITPVQFRVGFALGKNCAYSTMKRLLAAGLWEKTGAGNRVRYRPISKQKK